MSILDTAVDAARKLLGETSAEVDARRKALAEQAVQDSVRRTRELQLSQPGLASTPYPAAIARQVQIIHKLRNAAEKAALDALAANMALEAAEKTLESLEEADRRHDLLHRQQGEHPSSFPEWQDLVDALFARGVSKHTLKQVRKVEISFIADLLRWKKEDPRHLDPASPWQSLLRSYASRTLQIVQGRDKIPLSQPGAPPRSEVWGAKYWHWDEARGWHNGVKDRRRTKDQIDGDDGIVTGDETDADSEVVLIEEDQRDTVVPVLPMSVETAYHLPALQVEPAATQQTDDTATHSVDDLSTAGITDEERAEPEVSILDPKMSLSIAEAYFDHECGPGAAFWEGTGLPAGTFDPERLIPALEQVISHGNRSFLLREFLLAAQEGAADSFYEDYRHHRTRSLSRKLREGDRQLLDEVTKLGLIY